MAELKTKKIKTDINMIIDAIPDEEKQKDCQEFLKIFQDATKTYPIIWSNGVIGFGTYHYKSDRSTQEGEWFVTGFSTRKQHFTIYLIPGTDNYKVLLKKLGKHKVSGRSCVNIKKLSDIDTKVLKKMIISSVTDMKKMYKIQE